MRGGGGCETEICTNLRLLVMSGDKLLLWKESRKKERGWREEREGCREEGGGRREEGEGWKEERGG